MCLALVPGIRHAVDHAGRLLAAGNLVGLRDCLRGLGLWAPLVSAALMQLQAIVAPLPSVSAHGDLGVRSPWALALGSLVSPG